MVENKIKIVIKLAMKHLPKIKLCSNQTSILVRHNFFFKFSFQSTGLNLKPMNKKLHKNQISLETYQMDIIAHRATIIT